MHSDDLITNADSTQQDAQLDAILADCIEAEEAGSPLDRDELLRRYPAYSEELKSFLANREHLEAMAGPLREPGGPSGGRPGDNGRFGDYDLLEEIARGGMGVVYKARQRSLGRTVALKMILSGRLANAADVERFREEAMAAASLRDSGIVAIHEVGEHQGQHYFSMDYVEGPSLADVADEAPLPAQRCAELVRDIARAVHSAHEQGVLHRDLKPSNVLLDESGQVHITDFGLAKRVESESNLTATGQVLGTPAYMAPEQASGARENMGRQSDVYSLGVILYELLTGRPPIRGETPVETLLQVQTVEPVSPRLLNPKVPRDLETIALKCLQKEPAKRYASALDLAHDLERVLAGEPILARPISRPERAVRWCRRHPFPTGLLATIALLLIIVAGVSTAAYFRENGIRIIAQRNELAAKREEKRAENALEELKEEKKRGEKLDGDVESLEAERNALTQNNAQVRRTYFQDLLRLARTQWHAGNAMLAVEYLDQCPPELRDEQWKQLKSEYSHEYLRLPGRNRFAINPDGTILASIGEQEGTISLWQLPEGELLRTLPAPEVEIVDLAIGPAGKTLAVAAANGQIVLWRLEGFEPAGEIVGPEGIHAISFSPDGKQLVAAVNWIKKSAVYDYRPDDSPRAPDPGEVVAWSLETLECLGTFPGWEFAEFDPTGRHLATGHVELVRRYGQLRDVWRVQLWDASSTGQELQTPYLRTEHTRKTPPVFSEDGGRMAVLEDYGGGLSDKVSVLDVAANRVVRSIAPGFRISAYCLSPDGSRIAYSIGGEFMFSHSGGRFPRKYRIVVWNVEENQEELVLPWQETEVTSMSFLPDGMRLATADGESVKLWNVSLPTDPIEVIRADMREFDVRPGDSPLWGGSRAHVNTRDGHDIPEYWNVGEFDRQSGEWRDEEAVNIKWVSRLGSQTYGNPVVANGRIFLGTNNGAGYLPRYPSEVDLGVLLCLDEKTGEFLWQHSNEKLPTGRVHDWPAQGVCSTPTVDGNRLWYVNNRGEVVCLDTEGFYDGEDDGPVTGEWMQTREVRVSDMIEQAVLEALAAREIPLPERVSFSGKSPDGPWRLSTWTVRKVQLERGSRLVRDYTPLFDITREGNRLRIRRQAEEASDSKSETEETNEFVIDDPVFTPLEQNQLPTGLIKTLHSMGIAAPSKVPLEKDMVSGAWFCRLQTDGETRKCELRKTDHYSGEAQFSLRMKKSVQDIHEADVVWRFNMMTELGVSQHNMSNCSVMTVGDKLFVCTSNGLDESHINLPAPDAPSFMAMDRNTGEVLWTDNSPGKNILHAQWASPSYGVFDGKPQVIFPGGDGWLYSFDPEGDGHGGSKLLWKFDCNPKESKWILGGRGTRNNLIAFPAIYDGLVYIAVGQDPEHGEGEGRLWCIDPTRRTDGADVSPELAVNFDGEIIPHRRIQAVDVSKGERAIPNPDSAVVWQYDKQDLDGNGKISFEEEFHRSISIPAIKDNILYIADFSGLFHCLHAKTGEVFWTYDMFAACWSSPLLVDGKVYIGDEDGEITVFSHSPDPRLATRQARGSGDVAGWRFIQEIYMNSSICMTPIVANDVLYIANRRHLFAIARDRGPRKASD